jgi:hypothetical protein
MPEPPGFVVKNGTNKFKNDYFDAIAGFAPPNRHRSLRFERSVNGIVDEIDQDLFDLRRVRVDLQLRSWNHLHFEPRLEIHHSLHQLAKIDIFLLWRRQFRESRVSLHESAQ